MSTPPFRVRAKTSYTQPQEYELAFREGDIITILEVSGTVASGELRGVNGLVNLNLVEPLPETASGSRPIPMGGVDAGRPPARGTAEWRVPGAQPAAGGDGIHDDWDDAAGADSVAVTIPAGPAVAPVGPSSSVSASGLPAAGSSVSPAMPAPLGPVPGIGAAPAVMGGGMPAGAVAGADGGVGLAEVGLHEADVLQLSSYINQIVKGEDLLLRVRRHLWWLATGESFLLFHFLIFYFVFTGQPTAHAIWFHLPHMLRLPVVWYMAMKMREVMTMEQLKLVLDPKSPEHLSFFAYRGLIVKAALVFAALTALGLVLDFIAVWVRIGQMNSALANAAILLVPGLSMPAVFLMLTLAEFTLLAWTALLLPSLSWGVPPELWERLVAHLREYSPLRASTPAGPAPAGTGAPVPAAAPASASAMAPVGMQSAPASAMSAPSLAPGGVPMRSVSGRSLPPLGAEGYAYPAARPQY